MGKGKVSGVGKTKGLSKQKKEAGKKPRRPYSRYLKRQHAALLRARYNIMSARSREVDFFLSELLHQEFEVPTQVAMLQAGLHKRAQVTAEDMAYGFRTSRTKLMAAI